MKLYRYLSAAAALLLCTQIVQAAFSLTLMQVDGDVVASGSGTINLTDLGSPSDENSNAGLQGSVAYIGAGPVGELSTDTYSGISGPFSIGDGDPLYIPDSGTGDRVVVIGIISSIRVPDGYVSGSLLNSTSTWEDRTLADLGITPGEYTWTWGSGANADTFTVNAAVPEPGTYASIAGVLALGIAIWRRRRG